MKKQKKSTYISSPYKEVGLKANIRHCAKRTESPVIPGRFTVYHSKHGKQ